MHLRFGVALLVLVLAPVGLLAQEQNQGAQKPAASGKSGDFDTMFADWKKLLGRLREIQTQWQVAMPDEKKKLETEFNELVAQGEKMAPELTKAAEETFKADPANKSAGEFLAALASDAK